MDASSTGILLLTSSLSVFGARVEIALAEKGIHYERREGMFQGNKSPLLLKSNPIYKKIPVLIHNGKPICESSIIVQYIDETWNEASPLLPHDPYLRSQARFWVDYVDKKVYEAGFKILMAQGEEEVEKASKDFIDILKVLEGQLGDKPYFMGETFGFVDISLVPFHYVFYTYETFGNFSVEKECPKLIEWAKRCMERESVSKAAADPHKFYDIICNYLKGIKG